MVRARRLITRSVDKGGARGTDDWVERVMGETQTLVQSYQLTVAVNSACYCSPSPELLSICFHSYTGQL
jgi:hypothetical protein